jgi:hypothetical protein
VQITTKEQFLKYITRTSTIPKGVEGYTPTTLVVDMFEKLDAVNWSDPTLRVLDPCFGFGSFLFYAYLRLKEFHSEEHILNNMLYGIEIEKFRYTLVKTKLGIKNLYHGDFLNPNNDIQQVLDMKFDCVLGNVPYQAETNGNSRPIWDKFVLKAFDHLVEGGYLVMIHPSGWRNVDGRFSEVRDLLLGKQMEYLEIHNEKDGLRTFGANTRYDWYVAKNIEKEIDTTTVLFEDGIIQDINLIDLPFIPNHSYKKVTSLVAEPGEETVEIIRDSSYHTQRQHISSTKTKVFKYPVVYTVSKSNGPSFKWSSKNDVGHFNVPKVIWGNSAATGFYTDNEGKYGLTEFAYAIADSPDNLGKIHKVLVDNYEELSSLTNLVGSGINYKVLATFRKDFWKEFV